MTPKMIKAQGDGIQLQVAIWEGKGPPVLCIHGLTANSRCWDLLASALAPRHRVVALDLRGRGLSEKPPAGYSVAHHCRDLLALMEDLKLKKPVLMGHSLGAFISLVFAAEYPERIGGVILVDGGGKLSEGQMAKVFAGIKPSLDRLGQVFPSFEAYVAPLKQAPFYKPWSVYFENYFRYEIEETEGGIRSRVLPAAIQEELVNLRSVDSTQYYSRVQSSVLILRATRGMLAADDLLLPEDVAGKMVREIPRATRVDLEANHYAIVFQPNERRNRAVLRFLEERPDPASPESNRHF